MELYRQKSTNTSLERCTMDDQIILLRIVRRLWGHVYDLLFLIKGTGKKDIDTIERELDLTEYYCIPYAQEEVE